MKRLFLVFLMALLLSMSCAAAEMQQEYKLGDTMENFTLTDARGETVTLYGLLEEKDVVLINLWATWCTPCRQEFPMIEVLYQQYQDQIEILALSVEPNDTLEVIRDFAEQEQLSFRLAQDTPDLYHKGVALESIPAWVLVDRYGVICFAGEVPPEQNNFQRLLDVYVDEGYEQSLLLTDIPTARPTMAPSPEAALTAALGAAAQNPTDGFTWPMLATEKDGRSVVASSNAGVNTTMSAVTVKVEARVGDAIAVTFKTSTEAASDVLAIRLNGEHIKFFGGEHDWMTYACPVTSGGTQELVLTYTKDVYAEAGEDTVWIDSVSVLSGQAAADALAANPVYPTAEAITFLPVDCEAREIVFTDEEGILDLVFGNAAYYIVDTDRVTLRATLTGEVDPEGASFSSILRDGFFSLNTCVAEDGYRLTCKVYAAPESVIPFTAVALGLDPSGSDARSVIVFRNEANVEVFLKDFELTRWAYADAQTADGKVPLPSEAAYTIRCVDQNGAPVPGVMVQICDETTCRVAQSDAAGQHMFTSAPYAWEIHVLMAPAGYTADGSEVIAPLTGGEIVLTLKKN